MKPKLDNFTVVAVVVLVFLAITLNSAMNAVNKNTNNSEYLTSEIEELNEEVRDLKRGLQDDIDDNSSKIDTIINDLL